MKKTAIAVTLLVLVLAAVPARADLVSTAGAQAGAERARLKALVERPELAAQMQQMGLAPSAAAERLDALSDAEVHALAGRIDQLAAGGDLANQTPLMLVVLVVILLILVL